MLLKQISTFCVNLMVSMDYSKVDKVMIFTVTSVTAVLKTDNNHVAVANNLITSLILLLVVLFLLENVSNEVIIFPSWLF